MIENVIEIALQVELLIVVVTIVVLTTYHCYRFLRHVIDL